MPEPHFHPQPKPRPRALDKADRKQARVSLDEAESRKVRVRSKGQCEVVEERILFDGLPAGFRCPKRANHVHHMLGGNGVRGRGESAKAERKQHVCAQAHLEIGNNVLVRIARGKLPHYQDRYRRAT